MKRSKELLNRDAASLSDVMKLRFYPIVAKSAKGARIWDADGKEYLDFSAGWGVVNAGYNHPRILEAVTDQMKELSFASTISVSSEVSVRLAEQLKELVPGDFEKKAWYGHSGSDANEFIAKIVPEATGKPRVLTFVGSYHGQTMGSYAMSGHPAQSRFIGGGNVTKLPYPYCYRCAFEKEPETCGLFCARYIEEYILNAVCAPDQVAAVVVEAVQCDGGDVVPPTGFLKALECICRENDLLLIVDEVKIGFGRTGRMFGFEKEGIVPDAVIMAKPMASGQPLSAVVGRKELMDSAVGAHLFTTAGNPVACAAALETIRIIQEERLMENAAEVGAYFLEKLRQLAEKYPVIGQVRGEGLVLGAELVEDRETKEPADRLAALVVYRAYELGLLFYDTGIHSNVLEFTPPLIITKEDVDQAAAILEQALEDALAGEVDPEKIKDYIGWSS
ncbi:aspartate aminotransferase family protein [Clostridiales bacterium]|nr:aspartate aminotransferase family protein [Clostridiales bacterium]